VERSSPRPTGDVYGLAFLLQDPLESLSYAQGDLQRKSEEHKGGLMTPVLFCSDSLTLF
jgi:hypothetical protein